MLRLEVWPEAVKFLNSIERKHAGQIALKIFGLLQDPFPPDSKQIKGTRSTFYRADLGEYRIVYQVQKEILQVPLIGKRNDDEIYKELARKKL